MRIIIVGGGKAGIALAKRLQAEDHEITVVDRNEEVIKQISNTLDVIGCIGNGATSEVLINAGVKTCDLLIAVAAQDEVNLLCCLMAHMLGARRTIARVRNPEYSDQMETFREKLGMSMLLNPDKAVAAEIARILRMPAATHVELFARGHVELVSFDVKKNCILDGICLRDIRSTVGAKVLICAVGREDQVFIPHGEFVLNAGDTIYMTGEPAEIEKTFRKADMYAHRTRSVLIAGGSKIAYYLAQMLNDERIAVKIIERQPERASELAIQLPGTTIINGDVGNYDLLDEEGIARQDAFVSLTGLDEANILSALYAQNKQVPKVIAKVNNESLLELARGHNLQTLITPKQVTGNLIVGYARALAARTPETSVLSLYKFADGLAEMLEFRVREEDKKLIDRPLAVLSIRKGILISCVVHGQEVIIPNGQDKLQVGDRVLVVTAAKRLTELSDILEA